MNRVVTPHTAIGTIAAPTSKSYAQRAIAAALLCTGQSTLRNMGLCNDTEAALDIARALGASVENDGTTTYYIRGASIGENRRAVTLNVGESGLSTRLFTPLASLSPTQITITGHGSILGRPIDAMQEPLRTLGVDITTRDGYLPLSVRGPLRGGVVTVDGSLSSQFITGLLMALPLAAEDTYLTVNNPRSIPYIDMTLEVLEAFGIEIENQNHRLFKIASSQQYQATDYNIEGDWSGASCMLVAGAIAGEVTLLNLNPASKQADRAILGALVSAGAAVCQHHDNSVTVGRAPGGTLRSFDFDATDCPDLFPALAALAAHCHGVTTIKGTSRLAHKESNRSIAIVTEFEKLGVEIDITQHDTMKVHGRPDSRTRVTNRNIDSHNDHRIAMATAVAALTADAPVEISGAESVEKSYPTFWDDLHKISQHSL